MTDHETSRGITDLLARAGDDGGRPLRTDPGELLFRARREAARRRRVRGAATLLVAAALVAGVVLAPRLVGDQASAPVAPVAPQPHVGHYLPTATVVQRCRPQLAKYAGVPGYDAHPTTADWHLSHEGRHYRAGDLVQLTFAGGDVGRPVLCLIPERGHEQDPVGFDRLIPIREDLVGRFGADARRLDQLRAVCAEQATEVGDGGVRIPDLRRATVLDSSVLRRVGAALLRGPDGHLYGCATSPPAWREGISDVERVGDDELYVSRGDDGRDGSSATTTHLVVAGAFGQRAHTLEVRWPGQPTWTLPVRDGYVAARAASLGGTDPAPISWRVLDTDGTVIAQGSG